MSKKTDTKKVDQAVTKAETTQADTGLLTWSDWFEHWPDLFARRWPETFRNMPFVGELFRVEQLTEDDGTIVIRAELPGLDPEQDVKLSIDDHMLTISGERRTSSESEENDTYRSEFRYGSFTRSIRLPAGVCIDDVAATYRDGILEVRVPVDTERPGVTHIPIAKQ